MPCKYSNTCGKLCSHFVVTTAAAFTGGNLVLTLPDNITYSNRERFCLVLGQSIPDETTRNAPVVAVIGAGTIQFPVLTRYGVPVTQRQLETRRIYPVGIRTSATSGAIVALCNLTGSDADALASLNAVTAAEGGGTA